MNERDFADNVTVERRNGTKRDLIVTRKDEKLADFKKCGHCGANPGGNRKYCAKPECQRAAAAARKARQRAREAEPVSESSPAEKSAQRAPEGPVMSDQTRRAILMIGECPDCFGTPAYGEDSCAHREGS